MKNKNRPIETERELEDVRYQVILNAIKIRDYVESIAKGEWSGNDFEKYGSDIYKASWALEEVELEKIKPNDDLLATSKFQKDLQPRILKQREIQSKKFPYHP